MLKMMEFVLKRFHTWSDTSIEGIDKLYLPKVCLKLGINKTFVNFLIHSISNPSTFCYIKIFNKIISEGSRVFNGTIDYFNKILINFDSIHLYSDRAMLHRSREIYRLLGRQKHQKKYFKSYDAQIKTHMTLPDI